MNARTAVVVDNAHHLRPQRTLSPATSSSTIVYLVRTIASAKRCLLGMHATQIADRIVRDLAVGDTRLHVTEAKSYAGIRTMKVPIALQPFLRELARGERRGGRREDRSGRGGPLLPIGPLHSLRSRS